MNKPYLGVAVVLLALVVWQAVSSHSPPSMTEGSMGTGVASAHSGNAPSRDPPDVAGRSDPAVPATEAGPAASTRTATAAMAHPPIESYRLTRSLSGDQTIQFEGREQRLLGTREVVSDGGSQTILLVRDELSGTIGYWQSGLRFALKPGVDREAFLREHFALRRLFVNTEYVDVAADAAALAGSYRSLAADPRVAGVQLLRLPRRDQPR